MSSHFLQISNLEFSWTDQGLSLLSIQEFHLNSAEKVFIYGPSGSGKTSFLNLLSGVCLPQQGSIHFLGKNIIQMSEQKRDELRADHVGVIFQQFNLIPYLNGFENIMLPCFFSSKRKQKVISSGLSISEAVIQLAEKMLLTKQNLEQPVSELSVGQQQRIAAVRALIGAPEMIIADEPTSSLDEHSQEAFLKGLFEQCEQNATCLVFVSHDKRLQKHFDRSIGLTQFKNDEGHQ